MDEKERSRIIRYSRKIAKNFVVYALLSFVAMLIGQTGTYCIAGEIITNTLLLFKIALFTAKFFGAIFFVAAAAYGFQYVKLETELMTTENW